MNYILEKFLAEEKAEAIRKINVIEVVENILERLSEREQDIISRRFGLLGNKKETLAAVGKDHQLTRERIRQVEKAGLDKLRDIKRFDYVDVLENVILDLIKEHGGLIEEEYLLNLLLRIFDEYGDEIKEKDSKNHFNFLISNLFDNFEKLSTDKFKKSYKLKNERIEHLEELAHDLINSINELREALETDEVIDKANNLESYKKNKNKFNSNKKIDISDILKDNFFEEDAEKINQNKELYSILMAVRELEQNKFGRWGLQDWTETKPKTINDKIYLVLKYFGFPMHFREIAERINELKFDKRRANPASVHNELIAGDNYVLIGRGVYALREWEEKGSQHDEVASIIEDILEKEKSELKREEIVERVLEKAKIRKNLINLALMNDKKFEKIDDKYRVRR